jgi:hypothetical protein
MSKLTNEQLHDLCRLATERVDEAFRSVDQLVEDHEQSLMLIATVIASMCNSVAEHLCESVTMPNGKRPTRDMAYIKVLNMLVKAGDVEHLVERGRR